MSIPTDNGALINRVIELETLLNESLTQLTESNRVLEEKILKIERLQSSYNVLVNSRNNVGYI